MLDQLTDADLAAMDAYSWSAMARNSERTRELQESHRLFHDVALNRYPPAVRDLTRSLHTMIYRHQRAFFAPADAGRFVRTDGLFLMALRDRNAPLVRQLLEFHLLDAALGLVLDVDPDHQFNALLLTLRGIGIDLEHDKKNWRQAWLYQVHWVRDASGMPALSTTQLRYEPATAGESREEAS